jgi:hypothetical protein
MILWDVTQWILISCSSRNKCLLCREDAGSRLLRNVDAYLTTRRHIAENGNFDSRIILSDDERLLPNSYLLTLSDHLPISFNHSWS